MTFSALVADIMGRLGLTSAEAEARVGTAVNQLHRRITATLGLVTSRRETVTAETEAGESDVTFDAVEKILNVRIPASGRDEPLDEVTVTQLRDAPTSAGGWPRRYAIKGATADSVTILLDRPADAVYELEADAYTVLDDLADDEKPLFAESFHDAVIEGVLEREYRRMEKLDLAGAAAAMAENIISDLRMFLAKSAYLRIRQGDNRGSRCRRG